MKITRVALVVGALLSFAAATAPASAAMVTYDWTTTSTSTVANGGMAAGGGTITVDTSKSWGAGPGVRKSSPTPRSSWFYREARCSHCCFGSTGALQR